MEADHQLVAYRPVLQRAGRACQSCRVRKIKCNVAEIGTPCNNCVRHTCYCYVEKSRRGRKPKVCNLSTQKSLDTLSKAAASASSNRQTGSLGWRDQNGHSAASSDDSMSCVRMPNDDRVDASFTPQDARHIDYSTLHKELSYTSLITGSHAPHSVAPSDYLTPSETALEEQDQASLRQESNGVLPDFVQSISGNISPQDLEFLWLRGALTVPDTHLRNALVRCFVEFVHPIMPVVDLLEFLLAVGSSIDADGPKTSILLFQAVMFSAVAFVDSNLLKNSGFTSRRAARKQFYERAKLLYDLDVESRPLYVIQALILLTHSTEKPGELKEGWHWLGIATSIAFCRGLHRNQPKKPGKEREWRQLRRIWWTCYVRDRQQAQYMSRPLRIRDSEFDVDPLTLDDFDLDSLEYLDSLRLRGLQVPFGSRIILRRLTQTFHAQIFIMMSQLCAHIGNILPIHLSLLSTSKASTGATGNETRLSFLSAMRDVDPNKKIAELDQNIRQWFAALPPCCLYQAPQQEEIAKYGGSLFVHRAMLHLAFHNTISTLHRSRALPPNRQGSWAHDLQGGISWDCVYEASREVGRISRDLRMTTLDRFVPTTVATMMLSPIIAQLTYLQQGDVENRARPLEDIFFCVKVLETMQELYASAIFCADFMADVLKRAQVEFVTDTEAGISGILFHGVRYNFDLPHKPSQALYNVSEQEPERGSQHARPLDLYGHSCSGVHVSQPGSKEPCLMQGEAEYGSYRQFDDWFEMLFDFEEFQNSMMPQI